MSIILGFLAGVGLPIQTSVNTRLRKKVGSPYNASLVSFVVVSIRIIIDYRTGVTHTFGTVVE